MRTLSLVLLALSLALVAGCFDAPQPNCVFLCGASQDCPEDYQCGPDNRCHRVLANGQLAQCQDEIQLPDAPEPIADASIDGPVPDGPEVDAPDVDAADIDAPIPDAPSPDAPTPDAPSPDAPVPDAALPDAPTPDAAMIDADVPDA